MCWAALIGVGTQAGQGVMQGGQDEATLNANANILDMKASDAYSRGDVAAEQKRSETAGVVGMQRAMMGASGVDVNTGSSAQVQTDTVGTGALDAETIRVNAAREAWGYTNEADAMRQQAVAAGTMKRFFAPGWGEGGGLKNVMQRASMSRNLYTGYFTQGKTAPK